MERLKKRDEDGRAMLTKFGKQIYCSTQATADCLAKLEDRLASYEDLEEQGWLNGIADNISVEFHPVDCSIEPE